MYKILTLNAISEVGLSKLPVKDFIVSNNIENPDGIILRSYSMHEMEFPKSLLAVARAGAGVNNIPLDRCSEKGIVVFNSPGANANAVKELVLTAMFISSRKIFEGIQWVLSLKGQDNIEKLVENGKSQFVGPEIKGKKLGVIGLGAIGVLVANAAIELGMNVIGYDPFLSIDAAWKLDSNVARGASVEKVVSECDYLTVHIPLNDKTKYMFNKEVFSCTKKGARLLNFSRGELVNMEDLKEAIKEGIIEKYIVDFPSEDILNQENIIAMPHLGASTPESEDNSAEMAANELREFLKYGNIRNSVNFPNCIAEYTGKCRVSIVHKNIPNMIGSISSLFASSSLNIDNMMNKSKGNWAYTLIDVDSFGAKKDELIMGLKGIEGVVNVRVVREV